VANTEDFISRYIDYTSAYESPTEFFYWSCVAGISATLRDNCYMLLGDTRVYPNVYILIVARPAMRKAKPLNSTIELLKNINNTKIIEGRTSIQAVIQRLGEVERLKNGITINGASGLIFSEEISAMFTEDEATIPVLTDLYDFKSSYTSSLVSRGTTKLTNVVITMLGASNEELLKPIFNNRAIYGGLLSRCLIVYGDKVRHRNSLVYEESKKYDPKPLQEGLRKIAGLKGYFRLTEEAKLYYDQWYHNVCPELEKKGSVTGADGRIHTNVLKLAMITAVSARCELTVTKEDVMVAIENCQSLFVNYRRLTLGSGKSKEAEPTVIILKALWESPEHKLTRKELMYKCWADVSDDTLTLVEKTLVTAGLITIIEGKSGVQTFQLQEAAIKFFKEGG